MVGRVKDDEQVRACHIKSSLAPEGTPIAFRLDKENGFEWIGEYEISAMNSCPGNAGPENQKRERIFERDSDRWTEDLCRDRCRSKEKGIKKKRMWNAKKELNIDSVKIGSQCTG